MSKTKAKNKDLNIVKSSNTSTAKSQAKAQNNDVSQQTKVKVKNEDLLKQAQSKVQANQTPSNAKAKSKNTQKAQDKRIRLSKDERKEQILMLSLKVFNQKGFLNTTMEDIVRASELSKGGVYYHYQNTIDILHDLMVLGIKYRVNIIKDSILNSQTIEIFQTNDEKQNNPTNEIQTSVKNTEQNTQNKFNIDFYANELYKKIITKNDFMDIYVQFLYAKKDSPKLENLFSELKELNKQEFKAAFGDTNALEKNYDFLTDFINSLILGANILNANELFQTNEILIKDMFKLILKED